MDQHSFYVQEKNMSARKLMDKNNRKLKPEHFKKGKMRNHEITKSRFLKDERTQSQHFELS